MQDDIAKAIIAKNGAPLTIAEHEDIVLQIKSDVAEAHAEILRAKGCLAKSMCQYLIFLLLLSKKCALTNIITLLDWLL